MPGNEGERKLWVTQDEGRKTEWHMVQVLAECQK